jgi:hypothetical protein
MLRASLLAIFVLNIGLGLTACSSSASVKPMAQSKRPPTITLNSTIPSTQLEASFFFGKPKSLRIAKRALEHYRELLEEWDRTYSDVEKNRIEGRMLDVLTRAHNEVLDTDGSKEYINQEISRRTLEHFRVLNRDYEKAVTSRERLDIRNDMLRVLTGGLKDIVNR